MELKRGWLAFSAIFIILMVALMACGNRPTPVVESQGRPATETAVAVLATTNAPPTAGPSPTPTPTSTPYLTPTPFPNIDPATIVAKVGSRNITLAEYQARVRYERWLPLYALARNLERFGPARLLDLTLPENAQTLALFYTLSNTESMGVQTMNVLLTEQVVLREAALRDLEMPQTVFDGRVAARIGVELGPGGVRPLSWDEAYARFIADMHLYTGMTEAAFVDSMKALAFYDMLATSIGRQAVLPERDITAVSVQDIILNTREDALAVIARLQAGENIRSIAASMGLRPIPGQSGDERTVRRDEENLPDDIVNAIFATKANDVIGPFATSSGWYVARILETKLDILAPADIESIRQEYFRQWILARLEDPNYTVDYDNWRDFIPTDPLPRDVSPMMRDEFFTLPASSFAEEGEPTPTPLPLGISPR